MPSGGKQQKHTRVFLLYLMIIRFLKIFRFKSTILNTGRRGFENVVFYINIFKKKGRSRAELRIRYDLDVFA